MRRLIVICILVAVNSATLAQTPSADEIQQAVQDCAQAKVNAGLLKNTDPYPPGWEHCPDVEKAWVGVADKWHADHAVKPRSAPVTAGRALADRLKQQ